MEQSGLVARRLVAKGSKSEHNAVVLVTQDGEYLLRRAQGNPFVDEVLESLVGRRVTCQGVMLAGSVFLASEIKPL